MNVLRATASTVRPSVQDYNCFFRQCNRVVIKVKLILALGNDYRLAQVAFNLIQCSRFTV